MEYKYCERCKKLYTVGTLKICSECMKELDECVKTIKEYLNDHPRANINTISKETEVSERDIFYLLKNERLELVNAQLVCDKCGAPIEHGRYCAECQEEMRREFSNLENNMKRERIGEDEKRDSYMKAAKAINERSMRDAARKMQVLDKYKQKYE